MLCSPHSSTQFFFSLSSVLNKYVHFKELTNIHSRLTKRSNFDDQHDAILKRIDIYKKKTLPVLEKYCHKVVKVQIDFKISSTLFKYYGIHICVPNSWYESQRYLSCERAQRYLKYKIWMVYSSWHNDEHLKTVQCTLLIFPLFGRMIICMEVKFNQTALESNYAVYSI